MQSATRQLLNAVAAWIVVAVLALITIAYFDSLKSITASFLGLPSPEDVAEARAERAQTVHAQQTNLSNGSVEIPASQHGQYLSEVLVNGRRIQSLVDTGASVVALTSEDAEAAGIFVNYSDYTVQVQTANGVARAAPILIDSVEIGGIVVRDVQGLVSEPGRLHMSLLGMSFLKRLSGFEMRDRKLILHD